MGPASRVEIEVEVAQNGLEVGDSNLSAEKMPKIAHFSGRKRLLIDVASPSLLDSSSAHRADRSSSRQLNVVAASDSMSTWTRPHVLKSLSRLFDLPSGSQLSMEEAKFASFSEIKSC